MKHVDTHISWEIPALESGHYFHPKANAFVAARYREQGEEASADCIELGMPIDHDSHVAMMILSEFIKANPDA